MTFAAFLVGLVGPVMARWIASMGLSLVVVTGLAASVAGLRGTMLDQLGGLGGDALMLAGLFGLWEAIGMVLGGITFVITWASTAGVWRLARV